MNDEKHPAEEQGRRSTEPRTDLEDALRELIRVSKSAGMNAASDFGYLPSSQQSDEEQISEAVQAAQGAAPRAEGLDGECQICGINESIGRLRRIWEERLITFEDIERELRAVAVGGIMCEEAPRGGNHRGRGRNLVGGSDSGE